MAGWLRRGLENRQNPWAPLGAERKLAISGWKMGLLDVHLLVGYWKWLAGQEARFPTHDVLLPLYAAARAFRPLLRVVTPHLSGD